MTGIIIVEGISLWLISSLKVLPRMNKISTGNIFYQRILKILNIINLYRYIIWNNYIYIYIYRGIKELKFRNVLNIKFNEFINRVK